MTRLLLFTLIFVLATACLPARAAGAPSRPLVYVALGASDAVGIGAVVPEREGWVPVLRDRLVPGSTLVNLGVSGSRLSEALEQQLPVALAAQPDLVTVWLAVNDLTAHVQLDAYRADLDRLLGALDPTGATVLLGNVPDVSQLPAFRNSNQAALRHEVDLWNAAIAEVAGYHRVVQVDLRPTWRELAQRPEYIAADGFHPSTAGYVRLADEFWQALQANGGPDDPRRG
jgi:lysophospholipase L1-like esterase